MLNNVIPADEVRSLLRTRSRNYDTKSVKISALDEYQLQGWKIVQKTEKTARIKKPKAFDTLLVDRVWCLLYRMGFLFMNDAKPVAVVGDSKNGQSQPFGLDVVAIDNEVGVGITCLSSEKREIIPQLQHILDQHISIRPTFQQAVKQRFALPYDRQSKRLIGLVMFTSNVFLTDEDKRKAKNSNVTLFDEADLTYYEALVDHLGQAAKYLFLADMLPGKEIPRLTIRVPAIKTKMGGYTCYTFSIEPEYLLKISFVSHRARGKGSDVEAYQRMLQKSRLDKIREYIDKENGIFPTNIVINLDKKPSFERREQETEQERAVFGWLEIRSTYRGAWIIDGQHRLFAYSGHPEAMKARLSVLAFEQLPGHEQVKLFVDINSKQKSVKQSLLHELDADLHKNSSDPRERLRSIIARSILLLDADPESPFCQRIQTSEDKKDDTRCITFATMFKALESDLYMSAGKKAEYGPFYSSDENEVVQNRTIFIIKKWFEEIRDAAPDWWDAGAAQGGGLAMNDSVTACINVLRSVFQHLEQQKLEKSLRLLSNQELWKTIEEFAIILSQYLGSLSEDQRKSFRKLYGSQGQITRMRQCQQAMHEKIPSFSPPGLQTFIEEQRAQTNKHAKDIVDEIEMILQKTIIDVLKQEIGEEETGWWMDGIPQQIRIKANQRYEEDKGARGSKDKYFDLIDYRNIIHQNWGTFQNMFGYGKANSGKDKRTAWLNDVNEIRKIVAHSSSGRMVTLNQLTMLEEYITWLRDRIKQVFEDGKDQEEIETEEI